MSDRSYKKWAKENHCMECGVKPRRRDYEEHLRFRIAHLERLLAMTPEQRARFEADQTYQPIVSAAILDEFQPASVLKPFLRFQQERPS